MKIHYAIGCLCIAAIIIVALGTGHNGVLAGAGVSAIVGLLTWQARKAADKRGGNIEATAAVLKKAGYTDKFIAGVVKKAKGGE